MTSVSMFVHIYHLVFIPGPTIENGSFWFLCPHFGPINSNCALRYYLQTFYFPATRKVHIHHVLLLTSIEYFEWVGEGGILTNLMSLDSHFHNSGDKK